MYFHSSITSVIFIIFLTVVCSLEDAIFKINKLNLIWTKAQHSLGSSKLKNLKDDLMKHETEELTLKKMKAHNQDKDGTFEATVRKRLLSIMSKYKLEKYFHDIHPNIDDENPRKKEALQKVTSESYNQDKNQKAIFRDKRLDKLWKKAEQSGFSEEQLMLLHEEFEHQQEKLDEHYNTMNMIEEELDRRSKEPQATDNSIESGIDKIYKKNKKVDESPAEKKKRLDKNVQQTLRDKYSDIKKNIDDLHTKIISGDVDNPNGPFEEGAVNTLWSSAMNANFTEEELDSFKEELKHFEIRIKKLKHFQAQLEKNDIDSKENNPVASDEAKGIQRKVKELVSKVDKTHKSLSQKLANKRDEL